MTLRAFATELRRKLAFYGFLACPLTDAEIDVLYHSDLTLEDAYSVACDVNAGFPFITAAAAVAA